MLNMTKTTLGSKFMFFTRGDSWNQSVFHEEGARSPYKKRYTQHYRSYDFSSCDPICVIQVQQEGDNFLIEYIEM